MGRILKLLTTALEQSKGQHLSACPTNVLRSSSDAGMLSLGETGELSPNASAMLRISALSAWAQLQVATLHQEYLIDVVKPHHSTLASLWVAALRDYAGIRVDSEFLHELSSVALDSSYSSLGKEVLLPVSHCYLQGRLSHQSPVLFKIMARHSAGRSNCHGEWRSIHLSCHGRSGV